MRTGTIQLHRLKMLKNDEPGLKPKPETAWHALRRQPDKNDGKQVIKIPNLIQLKLKLKTKLKTLNPPKISLQPSSIRHPSRQNRSLKPSLVQLKKEIRPKLIKRELLKQHGRLKSLKTTKSS